MKMVKSTEFITFLMDNLRWTNEAVLRHIDKIRDYYFPNLSAMGGVEIEEGLVNVSNLYTDFFIILY